MDEFFERLAFSAILIGWIVVVGMAKRHAADQFSAVGDVEQVPDNVGVLGEGGLRAGLEPVAAGCEHHVLDEHAHVHPRAFLEDGVDEKEHHHRRAEAVVVFHPLRLSRLDVVAFDAQRGVERMTAGAFPGDVRLLDLRGVILVVGGGLFAVRPPLGQGAADLLLCFTGEYRHMPRLAVDPGRRPPGAFENPGDEFIRNRLVEECPDGFAISDCFGDFHCLSQFPVTAATRKLAGTRDLEKET